MKISKLLRVIFSVVLLMAVIPSAALCVYAADDGSGADEDVRYNLIGFVAVGPEGALRKVLVEGAEVPECDPEDPDTWGTFSLVGGEKLDIEMFFNDGYNLGYWGEATVCLAGIQSEATNITNTDEHYIPKVSVDVPGKAWQDSHGEEDLYLIIFTAGEGDQNYLDLPKLIDTVKLNITPPLCGTIVTAEKINVGEITFYDEDTQVPRPEITLPDEAQYFIYEYESEGETYTRKYWLRKEDPEDDFSGFDTYVSTEADPYMKGGDTVYAVVELFAKEGYIFSEYVKATINGNPRDLLYFEDYDYIVVIGSVTVEHIPGDPEEEEGEAPTCLEDGYHYEVVHCTKCSEEISREKVTDDALGHDWGEWKVTKEPTDDADGEETRICKRDPSHIETRPLEKDSPDTSDSGKIILWGTLSAMSLAGLVWLDHESRKHSR